MKKDAKNLNGFERPEEAEPTGNNFTVLGLCDARLSREQLKLTADTFL